MNEASRSGSRSFREEINGIAIQSWFLLVSPFNRPEEAWKFMVSFDVYRSDILPVNVEIDRTQQREVLRVDTGILSIG